MIAMNLETMNSGESAVENMGAGRLLANGVN
jgi:hypothetical protein